MDHRANEENGNRSNGERDDAQDGIYGSCTGQSERTRPATALANVLSGLGGAQTVGAKEDISL